MALLLATAGLLGALGAAGCETTREQAATFGRGGNAAFRRTGLAVGRANADVRVRSTAVVSDANGTAVVAVLRNTGRSALADVPLGLVVRSADGGAVARNDTPGLEHGLTHAARLPAGADVVWVNDQVTAAGGRAVRADVTPGRARAVPAGAGRVAIDVVGGRLEGDASSGVTAVARAVNRSAIAQRNVVIACVARSGGRVVAAGRAIVPVLRANGRAQFQVFFIGDPTGAELTFDAQPPTLE